MENERGEEIRMGVVPNGHRGFCIKRSIAKPDGYVLGAEKVIEFSGWAKDAGIKSVVFYGVSGENMKKRTREEILALSRGALLFCEFAEQSGLCVRPFGDLEEYAHDPDFAELYAALRRLQQKTYEDTSFTVYVAANYSGSIEHELSPLFDAVQTHGLEAVRRDPKRFSRSGIVPPVDLFIRTGSDEEEGMRTSGFVPFQIAYAQLFFLEKSWPEFTKRDFDDVLERYKRQKRNFGK